jgi:hypothetical protein
MPAFAGKASRWAAFIQNSKQSNIFLQLLCIM